MTGTPKHTLRLLVAGAAVALLACSSASGPLTDAQVSLRPQGLLQVTAPAQPTYPTVEPGGNKRFARAYYGAPPMIPHSVADVELTAGTNDCLDCHETSDDETPGIPPSHRVRALFTELPHNAAKDGSLTAFTGFGRVTKVAGNRYDCVLCHAPQSNNTAPLVENDFKPAFPAGSPKDSLQGLKVVGTY